MGKIYVNQTKLRIEVNTGLTFEAGDTAKLKYMKPGSYSPGEFEAVKGDNGLIYYDVTEGDLNVSGKWKFWAFITFSDETEAPGEPFEVTVYNEGE